MSLASLAALYCAAGVSAAALAPASQQHLTVGIGEATEGRTLDPALASYVDTINVQSAFLAPLYTYGPSGAVPVLAAGAPIIGAGGRTVTIKLRAARWSDGVAISSTDVATALARARAKQNFFAAFVLGVTTTTPNARTVVFHLKHADPVFPLLLTMQLFTPVPAHVIKTSKERWTVAGTMVSSGPFVLKSSTRQQLVGVRNPRYVRAGRVHLKQLTLRSTAWAGAASSQKLYIKRVLDAVFPRTIDLRNPSPALLKQSLRYSRTSAEAQYLYLNTTNGKLADPRIRRGIALAIDRARTASTRPGDRALSTVLPGDLPGSAAITSGTRLLNTAGTPDTAAALAQLAAGAWNTSTVLNLEYSSDSASAGFLAAGIQTQLAAVGVRVVLKPLPGDVIASPGHGISPVGSSVDMLLQGWVLDYPDPFNFYQLFLCHNVKNGLNASNFCDPSFDAALQSLATEFSFPKRVVAYRGIEEKLTGPEGSFPVVPLYSPVIDTLVHTWVRGFKINSAGVIDWDSIAVTKH